MGRKDPKPSATLQAAYNDIEAIRLWKCGDGDKARCGAVDLKLGLGFRD